ncbi:hypothetical protein CG820_14645, partial [Enterococcus faecium]
MSYNDSIKAWLLVKLATMLLNLLKLNWIEEIPSREKRRRVYKITDLGEEVLRLEIERLGSLI